MKSHHSTWLASASAVALLAMATTSYAQTTTAPEANTTNDAQQDDATSVGDVVVTGTRLRTNLTAPTPVVQTSQEQLQATAPGLVSDALNQLPVFKGSSRASNGTQSSSRDNGASFLNLRGLGSQRTLVLLDGRRFVSSSTAGVPDVNLFPQDLINRVEIVTGGASAAYGSDAVAGVVNFVLDRDFTGLRLKAQAGVSGENDNGMQNYTATYGRGFADDRGHFLASAEYFAQDGLPYDSRPEISGYGLASSGLTGTGVPSLIVAQPYLFTVSRGGLITTGPFAGTQFLPGGATGPYDFGTNRNSTFQVGGDGDRYPFDLSASIERKSIFTRAEYKVTDKLNVFGEISAAQVHSTYDIQPSNYFGGTAFTIFSDNAYLPEAFRTQLLASGTTSFRLSRVNRDWPLMRSDNESTTTRFVGGFDYDWIRDWQLTGYYMHGENHLIGQTQNDAITRNVIAAVDAVVDPVSGKIVCRSTLSGFDPGCVPMNVFGDGSPSAASIAYATGTAEANLRSKQDIASLTLRGTAFSVPAGDVSFALGAEYRREESELKSDALSQRVDNATGLRGAINRLTTGVPGAFQLGNPQPLSGEYDVREGFLEVVAPVLADLPFVHALNINGGVRLIDYSTVGQVTTWKVGLSYEPFEDLRFRGTRSRDIRAANAQELFTTQQTALAVVTQGGVSRSALGLRGGNPNLAPEIADTVTYGVVYRPHFIPGLGVSLDYFNIDLAGAITQLSNQQTIDQCALGVALACDQISTNSDGLLLIRTPNLNLASLKTDGIDFELTYTADVGPGRLGVRGLVSYLGSLETALPNAAPVDRAGDIGNTGTPHYTGSLLLSWDQGPFSAFIQERYIGGGRFDNTLAPGALADDTVDPVFYTDLTVRYRVDAPQVQNLEVFATVNNLFDKEAPIVPFSPFGVFRSTNPTLYDVVGRYFTAGIRLTF